MLSSLGAKASRVATYLSKCKSVGSDVGDLRQTQCVPSDTGCWVCLGPKKRDARVGGMQSIFDV